MIKRLSVPVVSGQGGGFDALWRMAQLPDLAQVVTLPPGYTWMGLDPFTTTPNALLGVIFGSSGDLYPLAPGAVIPIEQGTTQVRVYNAGLAIISQGNWPPPNTATYKLNGQVGLVVGTDADLLAWTAYTQSPIPSPKAAVLATFATNPAGTLGYFHNLVPFLNLRSGARVSVVPLDGAGAVMDPTGIADFTVTLRPRVYGLTFPAGGNGFPVGLNIQGDPIGPSPDGLYNGINMQGCYHSSADMIFTQTDLTADYPVVVPTAMASFLCVALAGTGVVAAGVLVEGW